MNTDNKPQEPGIYDELTGAYIKSLFWPRLEEELDRCIRFRIPLALVILDLDQFKLINDVYGHLRGDEILSECGRLMKQSLRRTDLIFRYGGDEFVIILPHTPAAEAQQVIERMIARVRHHVFEGTPPVRLSLSAGMAFYPDDGNMEQHLFNIADQRLKEAKRLGGDCYVATSETSMRGGSIIQATRLIEREEFRSILENFISTLVNRRNAVLEITGDWGTGKTRALEEVLTLARLRGMKVLHLNSQPDISHIAFGYLRELLKHIIEVEQPDILNQLPKPLSQDVQLFLESFQQYRQSMDVSESGVFRLNQAVLEMFQRLSEKGLILAIDDAHYVDDRSLEFIRSLVLLSRNYPLGFVYTHPNLTLENLSWQAGHVDFYHTHLRPLSYRGVKVLISLWLKWDPPEPFVQYLYQLSAGNPALLERLITGLYQDGFIYRQDSEWHIRGDIESFVLPSNIQHFITERLSRLSETAQKVAKLLSVIGGQTGLNLILTSLNLDEAVGLRAIRELEEAGLVWEIMEHQYRFRYELLTHTLYESLDETEKIAFHRAIALAIERTHGTMKEHTTELLALHFLKAGDIQKSVHYYLESARAALQNHAYNEAIEHYQRALRLCEEHHMEEQLVEICYQLSHLYAITGRRDLQAQMADRALQWIQNRDVTTRRLEELILLNLEARIEQIHLSNTEGMKKLENELKILLKNARKDRFLPVRLLHGQLKEKKGEHEEAETIYREVMEQSREKKLADVFYTSTLSYARVLYERLCFDRAFQILRDALSHEFHRDPYQAGWLLFELGKVEKHIQPIRKAHNHLVEAYQVAYIHGLNALAAESAFLLSTLARLQGYWDTASRWAAAAREQAYKSQDVLLRARAEWYLLASVSSAGDGSVVIQQGNRLTHYAELLRSQKTDQRDLLIILGTVHFFWKVTGGKVGRSYETFIQRQLSDYFPVQTWTVRAYDLLIHLFLMLTIEPDWPCPMTLTSETTRKILEPLVEAGDHYFYARLVLVLIYYYLSRRNMEDIPLDIIQEAIDRATHSGLERVQKELIVGQMLMVARKERSGFEPKQIRNISEYLPDLSTLMQILTLNELIQMTGDKTWKTKLVELQNRSGYQWTPEAEA